MVCGDCNAGPGCLLDRVGLGICGDRSLVSSKEKPALKSCEVRHTGEIARLWGISGYGRMAGLWGSDKTYGKTAITVWGDGRCVGGRRIVWEAAKTYGKCHVIWEPAPAHGEAASRMGSQNRIKTRNMIPVGGLWTLHVFQEFLAELRFSGRPLKCMGISRTRPCMSGCVCLVIWTREMALVNLGDPCESLFKK